jgi:hypothetical protein
MRSGGFPCRASQRCAHAFAVRDQNSMDSLQAASAARAAHEIREHGYYHVALAEQVRYTPLQRVVRPRMIR